MPGNATAANCSQLQGMKGFQEFPDPLLDLKIETPMESPGFLHVTLGSGSILLASILGSQLAVVVRVFYVEKPFWPTWLQIMIQGVRNRNPPSFQDLIHEFMLNNDSMPSF